MNKITSAILCEVKKAIVGKDDVIEKVFMSILSGGHVLLEDVPGVGKTTLALAFSRALGLHYKRVQFTSDSVPSDVIGFSVLERESGKFVYKPGAVMTNLLLADEINRTSSKTQSALLEAMEEGKVTVDGTTYVIPKPFIVLATQNPVGSAGTQMLPASQLDRFMVRLGMGYPDHESQINILRDRHTANPIESVGAVSDRNGMLEMQKRAAQVHVSDIVYDYVTRLAEATREHELVVLGISPRGALAVCQMAKSFAFVKGREYVTPEDVAAILTDVCAHRLVLSPKARMTESGAEDVISGIIGTVKMPVL
jgi:MoxR-like ATPase